MSATLYLKGGAVIENVMISAETVKRALENGDEWMSVRWQPGRTAYNPESDRLDVLVSQIAAVKAYGR